MPATSLEQAALLRQAAADTARVMPAGGRDVYAGRLAKLLGVAAGTLTEEWSRHAAEVRTQTIRERVRQHIATWLARLGREPLATELEDASRLLSAARQDIAG